MRRRKNNKFRKKWYLLNTFLLILSILLGSFLVLSVFRERLGLQSPLANKSQSQIDFLKKSLLDNNLPFSSVERYSEDSYLVKLSDGGEVVISSNKDINIQVRTLQLMVSRLTIEGKAFKRIDLRYINPFIQF